eukprot:TRINITY_DN4655_c0_g1_i1.p1 TRINITY_DN4655_c0_g1~~TRINITY_DN4655_c0_g1_i1.p1  ORF type:complete len:460 (-),score=96.96 TRINITY_DN4655_c0_g1_i1:454-1833(-)
MKFPVWRVLAVCFALAAFILFPFCYFPSPSAHTRLLVTKHLPTQEHSPVILVSASSRSGTAPTVPCRQKRGELIESAHGGSAYNLTVRSLQTNHWKAKEGTCLAKNVINIQDDSLLDRKRPVMASSRGRSSPRELISASEYSQGIFKTIPGEEGRNATFSPNFNSFTLCPNCLTKYYNNVCLLNGTIYSGEFPSQYKVWTYAGTIIFNLSAMSELPSGAKPEFVEPPAFFAWMPCEGNLFHMIFQTYAPLYTLLAYQNLMGREVFGRKIDFYADRPFGYDVVARRNDTEFRHGMCRSPKYLPMFDLLPVNLEYDYYGDPRFMRQLRCYKHAFFGFDERMEHKKIVPSLNFAKRHLLNQTACQEMHGVAGHFNIIMIQRHHRGIANMGELQEKSLSLGSSLGVNVTARVVYLEDLNFLEQMELFSCWGDVMFGVQGAGMAWGYFMREKRGLIEVGWKKWE